MRLTHEQVPWGDDGLNSNDATTALITAHFDSDIDDFDVMRAADLLNSQTVTVACAIRAPEGSNGHLKVWAYPTYSVDRCLNDVRTILTRFLNSRTADSMS